MYLCRSIRTCFQIHCTYLCRDTVASLHFLHTSFCRWNLYLFKVQQQQLCSCLPSQRSVVQLPAALPLTGTQQQEATEDFYYSSDSHCLFRLELALGHCEAPTHSTFLKSFPGRVEHMENGSNCVRKEILYC